VQERGEFLERIRRFEAADDDLIGLRGRRSWRGLGFLHGIKL
jgi:hypothetical protein